MLSSISLLTALLSVSYHAVVAQNSSTTGQSGAAGAGASISASASSGAATASASASSGASLTALAAELSTSCQASAGSLLTSDFGSCANIIGLASVIGGSGSVVSPLTNWITAICSADPCSNSTLDSAKQTVSSGCSSDLQKGSSVAIGLNTIISNYPTIRSLLCTQYVSNSTFCVPSILGNIQTATGQNLTLIQISGLLSSGMSASTFSQVPSGTYCNDCGHALVTLSAPLASSANMMATPMNTATASHNKTTDGFPAVCGASFTDGKIPATVKLAAKGASTQASSNAQNSAAGRQTVTLASAAIVTLTTSLVFFAC